MRVIRLATGWGRQWWSLPGRHSVAAPARAVNRAVENVRHSVSVGQLPDNQRQQITPQQPQGYQAPPGGRWLFFLRPTPDQVKGTARWALAALTACFSAIAAVFAVVGHRSYRVLLRSWSTIRSNCFRLLHSA